MRFQSVQATALMLVLMVMTFGPTKNLLICSAEPRSDRIAADGKLDFLLEVNVSRARDFKALANLPPDGKHLIDQWLDYFGDDLKRLTVGGAIPDDLDPMVNDPKRVQQKLFSKLFLRLEFEKRLPEHADLFRQMKVVKRKKIKAGEIVFLADKRIVVVQGPVVEIMPEDWNKQQVSDLLSPELKLMWDDLPRQGTIRFAYHAPTQTRWATPGRNQLVNQKPVFDETLLSFFLATLRSAKINLDLDAKKLLHSEIDFRDELAAKLWDEASDRLFEELRAFKQLVDLGLPAALRAEAAKWIDTIRNKRNRKKVVTLIENSPLLEDIALFIRRTFEPGITPTSRLTVELNFDVVLTADPQEIVIQGKSNFPSGTKVRFSLKERRKAAFRSTSSSEETTVNRNGQFKKSVRAPAPFKLGDYEVVLSVVGSSQPKEFADKFGENGRLMKGANVIGNLDSGLTYRCSKTIPLRANLAPAEFIQMKNEMLQLLSKFTLLKSELDREIAKGLLTKSARRRTRTVEKVRGELTDLKDQAVQHVLDQDASAKFAAVYSILSTTLNGIERLEKGASDTFILKSLKAFDKNAESLSKYLKRL